MVVYKLYKNKLHSLVSELMKDYDVIGPVKRRETTYDKLSSPEELEFGLLLPINPAKHWLLGDDVIFEFGKDGVQETIPVVKPRVMFGLRRCDLNAIKRHEMVFLKQEPLDPHVKARFDKTVLIGHHCLKGDRWCFCQSLKMDEYYDIMIYETEQDYYLCETNSAKGLDLTKKHSNLLHESELIISPEMKKIENADNLKNTNLKGTYDRPEWKELSDICFSCGACNHLCPTCYCFELKDEVNLDMKSGRRVRTPSACQLKHFTRVAGEHIFRPERLARFKHRIFHQMVYFKEVHGTTLCTGCGRCIRACPVRIDWLRIANQVGGL